MDAGLKALFIEKWKKYFPGAGLPVAWYYSDEINSGELEQNKTETRCLIGNLNKVMNGETYIYSVKEPGCLGGKFYTGYAKTLRKNFEYFLSCGIEGEMDGERYKKTPELVSEQLKRQPVITAPQKYLIFKRWDKLNEDDEPKAVVFFATADVLSGLFTLANYDEADLNAVITPFGAGCSSIIQYPMTEAQSDNPRCVLGMFDISARPHIPAGTLTFAVPMGKFIRMIHNMEESFLITKTWENVKHRLEQK
ncbi:MAG: DUF169 domain-containing protein [Syntrophothermus sp.]